MYLFEVLINSVLFCLSVLLLIIFFFSFLNLHSELDFTS